jgi:hypothetical protein
MAQSLAYVAEVLAHRTRFCWVVLGLIFAIYTVASADRANIGISLPYIQKDFGLTNTQVGAIASLFALAYGIFQIPSAFLIRCYGVRAVLPLLMILTSVFTASIGAIDFFSGALRRRCGVAAAGEPVRPGGGRRAPGEQPDEVHQQLVSGPGEGTGRWHLHLLGQVWGRGHSLRSPDHPRSGELGHRLPVLVRLLTTIIEPIEPASWSWREM